MTFDQLLIEVSPTCRVTSDTADPHSHITRYKQYHKSQVTKGDRIYHDQIDDQTLRRPDQRPDHSRRPDRWPDSHRDQNVKIRSPIWSPGAIWSPIWSSDEACFSSHLFKRLLIFAQKAQLQSNLVTQERSGRPEAIWSPIRSPGHLVVDLVVVNAFSFTSLSK